MSEFSRREFVGAAAAATVLGFGVADPRASAQGQVKVNATLDGTACQRHIGAARVRCWTC